MRTKDTIEKVELKLRNDTIFDEKTGCWLYQKGLQPSGYCMIMFGGKRAGIHRISAHLYLGFDLDSEMSILHRMQCPNKNCWNPDHLYEGTQADNVRDSVVLGTHPGDILRKTCKRGHPLDGINSQGKRFCKTCHREANLRSYRKTHE